MSERTPESLIAAATASVEPGPAFRPYHDGPPYFSDPASQQGAPNAANMSMEQPAAPDDIEFEWIPVAQWRDKTSGIRHLISDIQDITGLLANLRGSDSHGRPHGRLYDKTIELLEGALSATRLELCEKILAAQGLPLPDDDVPAANSPA